MVYNVYITQITMARAAHAPIKTHPEKKPAPVRGRTGKTPMDEPARGLRAPLQILKTTKGWLDQIRAEENLRTYDEAIMFLITERQRHLPSDLGVFSNLEEYACEGED